MLHGESKLMVVRATSRGREYNKCLVNIPINLFKSPNFPFKSGDHIKILVDPDLQTVLLTRQPEFWEELIKLSKEVAKHYRKVLKSINSDCTLSHFQKKYAKLIFETLVEKELPNFLSETAKKAREIAEKHTLKQL